MNGVDCLTVVRSKITKWQRPAHLGVLSFKFLANFFGSLAIPAFFLEGFYQLSHLARVISETLLCPSSHMAAATDRL